MRLKDIEAVEALRREAAKRLGESPDDLEYYAWEQTFANTTGPRGGLGGQVLTRAAVHAFKSPCTGRAELFCVGVWKRVEKGFAPMRYVDFGANRGI